MANYLLQVPRSPLNTETHSHRDVPCNRRVAALQFKSSLMTYDRKREVKYLSDKHQVQRCSIEIMQLLTKHADLHSNGRRWQLLLEIQQMLKMSALQCRTNTSTEECQGCCGRGYSYAQHSRIRLWSILWCSQRKESRVFGSGEGLGRDTSPRHPIQRPVQTISMWFLAT